MTRAGSRKIRDRERSPRRRNEAEDHERNSRVDRAGRLAAVGFLAFGVLVLLMTLVLHLIFLPLRLLAWLVFLPVVLFKAVFGLLAGLACEAGAAFAFGVSSSSVSPGAHVRASPCQPVTRGA